MTQEQIFGGRSSTKFGKGKLTVWMPTFAISLKFDQAREIFGQRDFVWSDFKIHGHLFKYSWTFNRTSHMKTKGCILNQRVANKWS